MQIFAVDMYEFCAQNKQRTGAVMQRKKVKKPLVYK